MYLVDETYFIKELRIPNANDGGVDVPTGDDSFESWVDEYARLLLQNALGAVLFTDFDSNVTNGVYIPNVTKWDNLVNGVVYTKNGVSYTWKGLLFTEGTFKGSVLTPYIYCKWLEFQLSQQTGVGEARGNAINSTSVNSTHRYVTIWNQFVEFYQGKCTQTSTLSYVKGIPFFDYALGNDSNYVSLIQFLLHNDTDYPDASLKVYEFTNTFGF